MTFWGLSWPGPEVAQVQRPGSLSAKGWEEFCCRPRSIHPGVEDSIHLLLIVPPRFILIDFHVSSNLPGYFPASQSTWKHFIDITRIKRGRTHSGHSNER